MPEIVIKLARNSVQLNNKKSHFKLSFVWSYAFWGDQLNGACANCALMACTKTLV